MNMEKGKIFLAACLVSVMVPGGLHSQPDVGELIQYISFDSVPAGVKLAGPAIALQGDVAVSGTISVADVIESRAGGFRFPDGTVQTTAAVEEEGLAVNRIPLIAPPLAYTEICFKDGSVLADVHDSGGSTDGGYCHPGDIGWLIERAERPATEWSLARATCLVLGLRLPEPFEFQLSCDLASILRLDGMDDNFEWASNATVLVVRDTSSGGFVAGVIGEGSCTVGRDMPVATNFGGPAPRHTYRCAR